MDNDQNTPFAIEMVRAATEIVTADIADTNLKQAASAFLVRVFSATPSTMDPFYQARDRN